MWVVLTVELKFGDVGFKGGKKTESKARADNKLGPHMGLAQNRTWATLVEGKHSHYCTNPAPAITHCLRPSLHFLFL